MCEVFLIQPDLFPVLADPLPNDPLVEVGTREPGPGGEFAWLGPWTTVADKGEAAAVLGRRIEKLRVERDLTIDELTARADIDRSSLEWILKGGSGVEFFEFWRLAGSLGVEPGELLEGIEWIPDGRGDGDYRVPEADPRSGE